jgi:hypothetical protein
MRTQVCSYLLLLSFLSACTKWEVQNAAPQQVFSDSQFVRRGVRITTMDNQRLEISRPKLAADTIRGEGKRSSTVAVSLQTVRELEVKRSDDAATVGLVLGSIVAASLVAYAAVCIAYCGID